jgi:leucyl aminopeptidase
MTRVEFTAQANAKPVAGEMTLIGVFEEDSPAATRATLAHSCVGQADFLDFHGQHGKVMMTFPPAAPAAGVLDAAVSAGAPVCFFGLGKREKFSLPTVREALTAAFKAAKKNKALSLALHMPDLGGTGVLPAEFGEAVATFASAVNYEVNHFKTEKGGHKPVKPFQSVRVLTDGSAQGQVRAGLKSGQIIASAVNNTRDLVNLPPSMCTPSFLAEQARKLETTTTVKARVLTRAQCAKLGMNALLAVSRGSDEQPKFIELTYEPANAVPGVVLGLVGKGITFDSGGLNIKTGPGMVDMKCDMAGAATVLSAIGAIAALKLPVRVKAFIAGTENMPGPRAYKPGDVITTMAGLTVEINNTDAEGRLTLADAIEYAKQAGCTHLIDLATLTGAMLQSLADVGAGLFTNDPFWAAQVKSAAQAADELVWEMPMWDGFKKANESEMADLRNSGGSFGAGSSTAALFIAPFAGKTPWVHLDIAGVAHRGRELGADPKGGTGWGVRTLVNLARQLSSRQ